jgi:hypothetical protein
MLVDFRECAIGEIYLFDLKDITRDDFGSFNFEETAITEDNGFQGKCLLQFIDNRAGLEFLDETDTSVEQEQGANDTEIDPILKTGSENGSSLIISCVNFNFRSFFLGK